MSKEKQTDRIIRNKLKYHASASPDHLWDAIDAQLTEDDNKGGGFWWKTGGLLGGVLLIGIFAALLLNGGNSIASEKTSLAILPPTTEQTTASNEQSTTPLAQNENTNVDILSAKESKTLKEEVIKIIAKKVVKKTAPKQISKTALGDMSSRDMDEKFTNKTIKTVSDNDIAINEDILLSDLQFTKENKALHATVSQQTNYFAALDLPSNNMLIASEEEELDWPSLLKDPKCATFGKWLKLYFYGDMYFSPDLAFRKLESKGLEYDGYTANREATESELLSFSTGLRLSVVSNYGLALRTGIVYSQINEKFKYENESATRTTVVDVFDDDGNLIRTDTVIETGTHYKTTHNQYRMIDVPILLGYEVNFKKFTLALNSGIYANLSSRQRGDFLSPVDLRPVTFTSDAENRHPAFRERLNLSLYGSMAFMYNLNDRWQLMLEPQFRYYLDPMTLPDYMVEQKYVTTGLITGLRYRF